MNDNGRGLEGITSDGRHEFMRVVTEFIERTTLSPEFLQPGYKATVIFTHAKPGHDLVVSNDNLMKVVDALHERCKTAGIALPARPSGVSNPPAGDEHAAAESDKLTHAIRRALLFLGTGAGELTAKRILLSALIGRELAPEDREQERQVLRATIAEYLAGLPSFKRGHPHLAMVFLAGLEAGASVQFVNEPQASGGGETLQ